ncbi:PREDICTED: tetraspanin-18-like [Nipponia nippon]|uniref:tetraspanin-18-like n=1 Tax=Nipponia nippon TaxID=128390 RepID=UPI000511B76E|nr:PREDICTED: tetraspanin-18-like [Nipponia nippon]
MGVLSCVKYLMFIFNVLVFAGGTCLAGAGVWVAVDPAGFQDIVAAKPGVSAGGYLLPARAGVERGCLPAAGRGQGIAAAGLPGVLRGPAPEPAAAAGAVALGDVASVPRSCALVPRVPPGAQGAGRFFILVSLVFLTQLVGAGLFLVHWKQIQPEQFLSELRRNYRGDEGAEVFSTAWNTLMVTVSGWEAPGPEDFGNGSRFQELHPGAPWPRACCARDGLLQAGELLGWEQCRERSPGYIHEQGCFATFGRTLQKYVSLPGTCSLAVLGIEIFAMFFAFCLYYNFD